MQHGAHRDAGEVAARDRPAAPVARECQQALAGPDQQAIAHCALTSAARQCLHEKKLRLRPDRMTRRRVAGDPPAVGEDADMPAQIAAVIEHIALQMRQLGEDGGGRVGHRAALAPHGPFRTEVGQPCREMHPRHRGLEVPRFLALTSRPKMTELGRSQPPSAAAMAASAASAFEPSGPPACAMSGRPPPPLPPSASAPRRTRSTALKRPVRSSVTPTTMPALPSSVTPTMATTPEPTCFLPSSTRLLRSLTSMPETARARSLVSPTLRTPSSAARAPPPPMASFFLASARSRSRRLRSSSTAANRFGTPSTEGLGWAKSKRSRSGATGQPFWGTWSPSAWPNASCSRWVAEWLARMAERRSWSTASPSAWPLLRVPSSTTPVWTKTSPAFLAVSVTRKRTPSAVITPVSPTWPPDSA